MSQTAGEPIRVLQVDDDGEFVDLASTFLERAHEDIEVITAASVGEGLETLAATTVDCVVSDYDMPEMDGLEFLEAVRTDHPELPFILFTGKGSEEIASEAISAGVTEYLQKETGTEQYAVLANRIERAVSETRAKTALEESERMLSTLISNLPGMVYRARNERDWPMEFVSDGCRDLTGYGPADLTTGDVEWGQDVIHPEDTGTMWEAVQEAIDAREPFEFTYRIRGKDGETRWVWEQGQGVYENGELVALEGFVTDITERREAQEKRRRYETIVESMRDGAYILDDEGRFEFVNEALVRTQEQDREELIGGESLILSTTEDEAVRGKYERAIDRLREGETDEVALEMDVAFDGEQRRTFNIRLTRLAEDSEFQGIVGVARDLTDRKERERELERYETLVEAAGDPVYALDAEGHLTMANEAMADVLEVKVEDAIGRHVSEFVDQEDSEAGNEAISEILDGDERTRETFEVNITDSDEGRLFEVHVAALTDDEGSFTGSVGVLRDITDHREREWELERYEMLVENVGDPMYALDESATITMVNEAMADHLNCTTEDLVGSHASRFMPEPDVETGTELISELLEDPDREWDAFEMETIAFDGERKVNEDKIGILTDEDGQYIGSVGVIRDITEWKERELELERYETIIQAVGDPVYALDENGRYTFLNDAVADVTGHEPAEIVGEHVSMLMPEEDIETGGQTIRELLESDERTYATFEMDLVTKDDDRIPHENRIALLPFDEDGEFRGTAGIVRDITERKQREQRLEQFASVVSHDLRNPLNVIVGHVEAARLDHDEKHYEAIEEAAGRMEALIDNLLTLARQGQAVGETESVELAPLAEHAWTLVDTGEATLSVENLGTVPADGARLQELFENLFRNAVEHGPDDVEVRVGQLSGGLFVADDGPGIPPGERGRVFEHGYSTNDEGTGFGLSIVRNVVDAHGWDIAITESEDGGARFEITGR
jgi:PAS domain S-box-containing protein